MISNVSKFNVILGIFILVILFILINPFLSEINNNKLRKYENKNIKKHNDSIELINIKDNLFQCILNQTLLSNK